VAGKGTNKSGGSGPRDLLEVLKALLLRKAEEWWQEMALSDVIPPVSDAAAVSRTVRARSRLVRKSSRSTAESSVDEADGFTTVVWKGRRNRPKKRGPGAQPPPTAYALAESAKIKGRASASVSSVSSLPSSLWRVGGFGTRDGGREQRRGVESEDIR
jgi:hypothetical protein